MPYYCDIIVFVHRITYNYTWQQRKHWQQLQPENVATVNALQLEVAQCHASTLPLQLQCHAKFDVAELIHCCIIEFLLLINYFTLWPWPLTLWPWSWSFILEHLHRIICDAMKLHQVSTQSINPCQRYCDFNIWPNDLERHVTYRACSGVVANFKLTAVSYTHLTLPTNREV